MITTVSDFWNKKLNEFHISKSLNPAGAGEPILWMRPLGVKPFQKAGLF
jgi:hypothetical protein